MLDFDKFGLTLKGLVYKRKLLGWNDVQHISLNKRGSLLFKTAELWVSPVQHGYSPPRTPLIYELFARARIPEPVES